MPEVSIHRNPMYLSRTQIAALVTALPKIIAEALSAPGHELTEKDIVIRDFVHSENDAGTMDLEITIMTVDSPERKANIQERTEKIASALGELEAKIMPEYVPLKKGKNSIWVVLVPGGFKIF